MKVSTHFVEAIRAHRPDVSKDDARHLAREALAQMGIPPTRADNYPHEFSGGMRQRIMIALGIVLKPAVIVADEPTTALDVIVEAQILELLDRLRRRAGRAAPDHPQPRLVAETCDRVAVMYAGRIVEIGPVEEVFTDPKHPYTQGLLRLGHLRRHDRAVVDRRRPAGPRRPRPGAGSPPAAPPASTPARRSTRS
jgi:peptide/nickel transport system ATP-binding protein